MAHDTILSGYDIVDIRENESGYNYFGFARGDGTWRILREKTDGTEYRFVVGAKDYAINFPNRATLTYKRADQLPKA